MKNPIILISLGILLISTIVALGNRFTDSEESDLPMVTSKETVQPALVTPPIAAKSKIINLALLLDTSNSMDGLIEQAKSQLWNIVDELADANFDGQPAELHIALYEYGNDQLFVRNGYVRQVSEFTQDLDEISTLLFALKTNGGSEYCGTVIKSSLSELEWSQDPDNLKLIFIAGNEPFDQGFVDYKLSCQNAKEQGVQINTIFCGDYQEGISTYWSDGAKIGQGEYMNIDMDQKTVYVSTPFDNKINQLNDALNKTYVGYGAQGVIRKEKQVQEDQNALSYSKSNRAKRAISKTKHVYKNHSWDLVDARKDKEFDLSALKSADLPTKMKSMTLPEKEHYLNQKAADRTIIQKEIQALGVKRKAYITKVLKEGSNELESAILESVKSQATEKGFKFK